MFSELHVSNDSHSNNLIIYSLKCNPKLKTSPNRVIL